MNWNNVNRHYEKLLAQVYPQPEDPGHTELAEKAIAWAMPSIREKKKQSVIDLGCGEGFCSLLFDPEMFDYTGIAWGQDVDKGREKKRNVLQMDFNSLDFPDNSFDGGLSRHSLEHSPFPILTLMEWRRVIRDWLIVVLPAPEWYKFRGQNHYSVMTREFAENCFEHSGWRIEKEFIQQRFGSPDFANFKGLTPEEYWYLVRKI